MKITTKTRYGLRAMIEIARETNKQGILQKEIARRQDLSNKYLDQIVLGLKLADLIMNVHGKKSGYILARPAEEITLFDIYQAFEPPFHLVDCLAPNYVCRSEERRIGNECRSRYALDPYSKMYETPYIQFRD